MERRSFMKYTGALTAGAISGAFPSRAEAADAVSLLSDAPRRFKYLDRLLRALCDDLGPHPSGSPEFEKAIHIIRDEMARALPSAELDPYTFERWELIGEPLFEVGGVRLETYPHHGCSGTSRAGINGILRARNNGYDIVSTASDEVLAHVSLNPYGKAIPRSAGIGRPHANPHFGIGKYDRDILDDAVAKRTPVRARAVVKFTPETPSWNAVGTLPGKTTDEILVAAHADTVYSSPGANDNTASVIVLLMLAHAFAGTTPDYTLRFLATGNEEFGTVGARSYAGRRKRESTYRSIRFVMQFDSLTYGPDLLLTSEDTELRALADGINRDLSINGTPRHIDSDAFVMDASPFRESGARAIYFNSRGYDGVTLPVYHRPEDIRPTVAFDCVDNSFLVMKRFINDLQTL